ncbi:MAG: PAS domain S-box protein [Rhodospirillaceae bacterium]
MIKALGDSLAAEAARLAAARRPAGPGDERIRFVAAVRGEVPAKAEPAWRAAAEQARDRAGPVLSAGAPEAALVLPVFATADPATAEARRTGVRGWVSLTIALPALVAAAQERLPLPLAVSVFEGGAPLLALPARPGPEGPEGAAEPAYTGERALSLGGRSWVVRCASGSVFERATRSGGPMVVLVLGVGFTLALWLTVMVLQANQRRFQDIAESASDWFWETNAGFEFTYISARFFEITGLEPAAVLGRTQWDVAGPRQIAAAREIWQAHFRVMSGRQPFRGLEITVDDRNGAARHILLSGKPSYYDNGIFRGYRGIGSDITERKAAEAEAAKKSAQLRAAIEAMPNGLIMFGEDLRLILYNRRFLELWGLSEEELEARRYLPHMIRHLAELGRYGPGDISQLVADRLARIVQPTTQGYELRRGDGPILEVRSYGRSEVGYLLTYLDISDRRHGEDALRQSEERLKLALAATRAGVWDIDLVNRSRWWSPELPDMLGYAPGELTASDAVFKDLVHPEDWAELRVRARRHLAGITAEFRAQYRLRGRTGDWTWVEDTGEAIRDGQGRAVRFIGIVVDISDRRATQAELMRSEKMAALGRLVAGVAHEVNTPVGLGVSVASFLDQKTLKLHQAYQAGTVTQEDFEDYLETARESCASLLANLRRAASLVRSFKLVAVDQSAEQRRPFNVRAYIDEVLTSLRPKLKKTRHTIAVACPPELVFTSDPGALSQILTNLVENSLVHGFDGWDEGHIQVEVRADNAVLVLIYADDGKGMPQDQLEKIFEPFFTTRMGQGGSGLGMHVVYNLVTQTLGGHIRCDSAPSRGMTVTIRLPLNPLAANTPGAPPGSGEQEICHDGAA